MTALGIRAFGAAAQAIQEQLPQLLADQVASRLMCQQDATLWGAAAEAEAAQRLGWTHPFPTAYQVLDEARSVAQELHAEGLTEVILAGMGGSSLAPELMAADAGNQHLEVLDTTDPAHVQRVLDQALAHTVLVVASKSGSTAETDALRRAFIAACTEQGLEAADHIVVITDPGSPLEALAKEENYRHIFYGQPDVGGRFSALSAFGIVPVTLAGVELRPLLADAEQALAALAAENDSNPALCLGAALSGTRPLLDKLVFVSAPAGQHQVLPGFAAWAEQLIAESTGKAGAGLLPVPVTAEAFEARHHLADALAIHLVEQPAADDELAAGEAEQQAAVYLWGGLGAQFVLWEAATAIACIFSATNPFDQPDVESAKTAARQLLDQPPRPATVVCREGALELLSPPTAADEPTSTAAAAQQLSIAEAIVELLNQLCPAGYLSVQAYLDRVADARLERVRDLLAERVQRPVTFGWGPRYLHSTGQYHKGGPANGVFLQLTTAEQPHLTLAGRNFTLADLINAQAAGDAEVLAAQGSPILRLRLTQRQAGIEQLIELLESLPR